MISVADCWSIIRDMTPAWPVEPVPIARAAGRVLAEAVAADRDQPPFDRVTMDGIAISAAAFRDGLRRFRIVAVHPAGAAPPILKDPGCCFEVMTGAALPVGCDCVVPVERIEVADGIASVDPGFPAEPGRFIHGRGTDYGAGTELLVPGTRLGPPEVAVLASVGRAEVRVSSWPSVTVVSTGDELVEPGQPVADHQVRRANDYAISAGLRRLGLERIDTLHLRDDPAAMRSAVDAALRSSDLLVLSGGVSRGKFDYLPEILDELGVSKHLHRVRQRPGKPMWFGTTGNGKPVFALPGNPVSALVCLARYVYPALLHGAGAAELDHWVRLGVDLAFRDDLAHFVPVTLRRSAEGLPVAFPRELNTSGDFFGLAGSDGFVELPAESGHCSAGTPVRLYRW